MKKENLVMLGAAAQKRLDLPEAYSVRFITPIDIDVIHIPVHDKRAFMGYGVEDVHLELFKSSDGNQTARVGYSYGIKTLFIELPKVVK